MSAPIQIIAPRRSFLASLLTYWPAFAVLALVLVAVLIAKAS